MFRKKYFVDTLAILALTLLIFLFFLPLFLPNRILVTSGVTKSDLMNLNYPYKTTYSQALKGKASFLWTPYLVNGLSLLAEGQTSAFYPLNLLLFYLLPMPFAFHFSLFLHFALAGLFTYLFVRLILKLSPVSGIIAGLSFSLSGFFVTHLVHLNMLQVFTWLPLDFLLLEMLIEKRKYFLGFFGLTLVFAFQILASHQSILYQIGLIIGLYLLARVFFSKKLSLVDFFPVITSGLALAFAAAISAIQILPSWELVGISSRGPGLSYEEATSYLFPLKHLFTLIVPWIFDYIESTAEIVGTGDIINLWENYLYLGLIPFFLSLLSLLIKKKSRYQTIFMVLIIGSLLLALGRTTPVFRIVWSSVPGMKLFRYPTRFLLFVEFGLAILASYGWSFLEEKLKLRSKKLILVSVAFIALIAGDLILTQWRFHQTAEANWWLETPTIAEFLQKNLGHYRYFSLGTSNLKMESAKDIRAQKEAQELLPANFNLIHQVASNYGQQAIFPETVVKLNQAVKKRMTFNEENNSFTVSDEFIKILSLQSVKYLLADLPLIHESLEKVSEVDLEKELVHIIPLVRPDKIEIKEVPTKKIFIYENKKVLPRTFLVGKAINSGNDWQNLDINQTDFSQAVYLQKDIDWQEIHEFEGTAEITAYEDEKIEIKTSSTTPAILILSDSFYPGWKAYIDDQQAQIFPANLAFRSVKLAGGDHAVTFRFEPQSFKNGLLITKISLIAFLLLFPLSFLSNRFLGSKRK